MPFAADLSWITPQCRNEVLKADIAARFSRTNDLINLYKTTVLKRTHKDHLASKPLPKRTKKA